MFPTMLPSGGSGVPLSGPSVTQMGQNGYDYKTASNYVGPIDENNWLDRLRQMASSGDTAAQEKLINYYMSEQSQKTARDWTSERENNQYQRLIEDLGKAGISPYILSGATPGVSSSSGNSYSGSQMVSRANNKDTTDTSIDKQGLSSLMSIIGTMLSAAMWALLIA